MFSWLFMDDIRDAEAKIPDTFKVESEYLKAKRAEVVSMDKALGNQMLINNPQRDLSWRNPTVLGSVGRY